MSTNRTFFALAFAFAAVSWLFFLPGLGGPFVLDDESAIIGNTLLHITSLDADSLLRSAYSFQPGGGSRPLAMVTFAIDYWRSGGLEPAAFKATNLLIHALTTLALAGFFRPLLVAAGFTDQKAAFLAPVLALAWAIHPLQVSSVLYVVQRMQTLGTLFLVLALWSYLHARTSQIDGTRSTPGWILCGLFWTLALASKEDSILLPAYTLALEFTVLRFRPEASRLGSLLRKGYLTAFVVGVACFLLIIVPGTWHTEHFPNRDFSSYERLLTQARVLVMYLGQIIAPLPSYLPFYHDGIEPSRGLLQPITTSISAFLILLLLLLAWHLRRQRPLFSFGILLFFAGHSITSNILGLELAFEHRNHFPLIGIVLALADLLHAFLRQQAPRTIAAIGILTLATLGGLTLWRADTWGSPLRMAESSVRVAPESERAWVLLCRTHYELSQGNTDNPHFAHAIAACERGSQIQYGAAALGSLIVLKTLKGDASSKDWENFTSRLERVPMTPKQQGLAQFMARNLSRNARIDAEGVYKTIDIISRRAGFRADEYAAFGYLVMKQDPDAPQALRYLSMSVAKSPERSRLVREILIDLRNQGRTDWADTLEKQARELGKI